MTKAHDAVICIVQCMCVWHTSRLSPLQLHDCSTSCWCKRLCCMCTACHLSSTPQAVTHAPRTSCRIRTLTWGPVASVVPTPSQIAQYRVRLQRTPRLVIHARRQQHHHQPTCCLAIGVPRMAVMLIKKLLRCFSGKTTRTKLIKSVFPRFLK